MLLKVNMEVLFRNMINVLPLLYFLFAMYIYIFILLAHDLSEDDLLCYNVISLSTSTLNAF